MHILFVNSYFVIFKTGHFLMVCLYIHMYALANFVAEKYLKCCLISMKQNQPMKDIIFDALGPGTVYERVLSFLGRLLSKIGGLI